MRKHRKRVGKGFKKLLCKVLYDQFLGLGLPHHRSPGWRRELARVCKEAVDKATGGGLKRSQGGWL